MPKIINDLKNKLQDAGKSIMLQEGYEALTIKKVAEKCNVGVGTVYNYYESKKQLLASILWNDWECVYLSMTEKCKEEDTMTGVFEIVYNCISSYIQLYQNLFFSANTTYDSRTAYMEQQLLLRSQIANIIFEAKERCNSDIEDFYLEFIIDNLIAYSMRMVPYYSLESIFEKLISK